MRFLSLFSGIEAASVAWLPIGWECVAVSEIEAFCRAALAHHYPSLPNLGSVTEVTEQQVRDLGNIDVVVFGFPCQDLSVAGKRKGLTHDGTPTRSGLFFDAMRIVEWSGARWALAENVPGLFSSNNGRDFATVVGAMAGADVDVPQGGWQNTGVATGESGLVEWCVLDAQWFGIPQRRRRVFVIRDTGDWRSRPPLLFNAKSLSGHPPPSREAGAVVARPIAHGSTPNHYDESQQTYIVGPLQSHSKEHGHAMTTQQAVEAGQVVASTLRARDATKGVDSDCTDTLVFDTTQVTSPGNYSEPKPGDACHPLAKGQHPPAVAYRTSGNSGVMEQGDKTAALNCGIDQNQNIIAFQCHGSNVGEMGALRSGNQNVTGGVPFIEHKMAVRRLTPRETERLQGFPDDYTKIPYRNKPAEQCPDGPRYRALGNSMAVPCMRWLGERIANFEQGGLF